MNIKIIIAIISFIPFAVVVWLNWMMVYETYKQDKLLEKNPDLPKRNYSMVPIASLILLVLAYIFCNDACKIPLPKYYLLLALLDIGNWGLFLMPIFYLQSLWKKQ